MKSIFSKDIEDKNAVNEVIAEPEAKPVKHSLFEIIDREEITPYDFFYIVRHTETGKRFIMYKGTSGGSGLAPLD